MKSLYLRWGSVLTAVIAMGMSAMTRADEPVEDGIAAVITKINGQKKNFETLIAEELSPQRQKIQEAFAETVGSLDDLIVQLRRNPHDTELAKKYDEVLSGALSQAGTLLGDYSRLREPTQRNLTTLSGALQKARTTYEKEMTSQKLLLTEHRQEVTAIEDKLRGLAEKHRTVLVSNQAELSRDAELEIQLLDADLQVARQNAHFDELAIQDHEDSLRELDRQLGELTSLKTSLEVTFRTAEGQSQLLTKITELRDRRRQGRRLAGNISSLRPIVEYSTAQNTNVGDLIQKFLDHDLKLNRRTKNANSGDVAAAPSRATEIMSRYLKTSMDKELTNVAN